MAHMETAMNVGDWQVFVYADEGYDRVLLPEQTHGADIIRAEELGKKHVYADGVFLEKNSPLTGVQTADCMPLIITSAEAALALHVSRKTLVAGLLDRVPHYISPADIEYVWIGPHICRRHFVFEWDGDEIRQFRAKFPQAVTDNPIALSLRRAVQTYFDKWRVQSSRVTEDSRCRYEEISLPSFTRWLKGGIQGPLPRLVTAVRYRM
jgi:copper oxidase (laccase) domain-containing protein